MEPPVVFVLVCPAECTGLDVRRERNWLRPSGLRVPDHVLDWPDRLARAATSAVLLAEGFAAASSPSGVQMLSAGILQADLSRLIDDAQGRGLTVCALQTIASS